jgi:hypothetical protein
MLHTLLDLRLRTRQRADRENSNFIENEELNFLINGSVAELHDLLVAAGSADYSIQDYTFLTAANNDTYSLPTNFYKMKGVDAQITNDKWYSMRPFNFNERNRNNDVTWGLINGPNIRYRLLGDNIKFSPAPETIYSVRLWFTPTAPVLVNDTDTLKDLNFYAEYVIVDAAIKYLQKEESDVTVLQQQKQELKRRIETMANNRDEGQPESISDIYAENSDFWFTRT